MASPVSFTILSVLTSLILLSNAIPTNTSISRRATGWTLSQPGRTGVGAMQLAVVSPTLAIIIDKVENNPLQINGHSAWAALYNFNTNQATALNLVSNSFCAGGTSLSNGTLVNVGGNAVVHPNEGDEYGNQGLRLFGPCHDPSGGSCKVYDNPKQLHLIAPRWYPTVVRISDGSALIIGGTSAGAFYSNSPGTVNQASYEYFPTRHRTFPSNFLARTVPANLFPIAFALPDGTVFIAANNQAIIYNTNTNSERALPNIPNGVRVTYPFTGTAALLPLSGPNYTPEVLICGGSTISDQTQPHNVDAQTPASSQCSHMVLNAAGIQKGWSVEHMLEPRIMPEAVLLPNGQILIINGGMTGVAGYGNAMHEVGASNADHPAFTPEIFDPNAPFNHRFSRSGMPTSSIARLYHSTATLTPMGNIMIAGSNPNLDVSNVKYATEYRVEFLNPPYMSRSRPTMTGTPGKMGFGSSHTIVVNIPSDLNQSKIQVALMDLGFATHATHPTNRLVFLAAKLTGGTILSITAPPNGKVYPPGPAWLYLTVDGVTSQGAHVMIGSGANPPTSS